MQNGVSLSTKDDDLGIKYGNCEWTYLGGKPRELAFASVGYLMNDMVNIRENYIRLGFHLNEFQKNSYYKDFGYRTMYDFCSANLGLDKSAVSRCISVWAEFASVDASHSRKMWIDDRYKDYSYSQLCEMVSMDEEERKQVKSDMTIKQIREIKKKDVSQNVSPVATSQQEWFNSTNYSIKKGIVQQNYVKNCRSLYNLKFRIFDKDGKLFKESKFFDVLKLEPGLIILRLMDDNTDIFP